MDFAARFNRFTPEQQLALLEVSATCINQRYEPKFAIYLYRGFGVLIEAYYHHRSGFINAAVVTPACMKLYLQPGDLQAL